MAASLAGVFALLLLNILDSILYVLYSMVGWETLLRAKFDLVASAMKTINIEAMEVFIDDPICWLAVLVPCFFVILDVTHWYLKRLKFANPVIKDNYRVSGKEENSNYSDMHSPMENVSESEGDLSPKSYSSFDIYGDGNAQAWEHESRNQGINEHDFTAGLSPSLQHKSE